MNYLMLVDFNPWQYFQPYLIDFYTWVPLLGTLGLICVLLYRAIRRLFK
ncbi:MAG: hypothetical protein ACFFAU_19195 [Candidatus Hodarchaeota archaeon]